MTRDLSRPFVRTLAVATFLGSIGFVGLPSAVSWAQGAASGPSGTAAPAPENGARPPAFDPMAQRISAGEKLDAAQLDGLRKFIAAFQALYDSMSDEQKKIADYVFRRSQFSEEPAMSSPVLPIYRFCAIWDG